MSKRLYVGNLSYNTTESDLRNRFAPFGAVSAAVVMDPDGRSKGFGFVEVADDQMNAAISATNGREVDGRTLTVNEARPRPERTGDYGGSSRGGSRGW